MPWICLQFVIVVIPDHTHLLFLFIGDLDYDLNSVFCVLDKALKCT